mmetsp:Transcript_6854/g.20091  ORF Transcript_6854/g.20091 Transcript_6854/m.20091 type:complete len:208 (+) Transcript_6854:957-1580(+)
MLEDSKRLIRDWQFQFVLGYITEGAFDCIPQRLVGQIHGLSVGQFDESAEQRDVRHWQRRFRIEQIQRRWLQLPLVALQGKDCFRATQCSRCPCVAVGLLVRFQHGTNTFRCATTVTIIELEFDADAEMIRWWKRILVVSVSSITNVLNVTQQHSIAWQQRRFVEDGILDDEDPVDASWRLVGMPVLPRLVGSRIELPIKGESVNII